MMKPLPRDVSRPGLPALLFAWTGALLFFSSQLIYVFRYLFRFGAVHAGFGPWGAAAVDVALFTAFALHHSVLARGVPKRAVSTMVGPAVERSVYTWTATGLFLLTLLGWQPLPGTLYSLPVPWRWIAHVLQLVGIVLTLRGSAAIDVLDLAGVRPVLDARAARTPRHVPLETSGAYRIVRHPLYFGWALFVFGTPDMTATRLLWASVSTLYLALAIPFEERSLREVFGAEYLTYARRTPWRLIPGIW